jgi:hypothetical protein
VASQSLASEIWLIQLYRELENQGIALPERWFFSLIMYQECEKYVLCGFLVPDSRTSSCYVLYSQLVPSLIVCVLLYQSRM